MSISRWIVTTVAALGVALFACGAKAAQAGGGAAFFDAGKFSCLQYTNGLGETSTGRMLSELAHLWVLGYLAGYYKAQGKLEMTDDQTEADKITELMLERCRDFPASPILTVAMQALANEPHKLPKVVTLDFSPQTYTCGQHVDGKAGQADVANKADLAELWSFAFIQGYKNVGTPDLEIPIDAMPTLTGAIDRSCASNRNMLFMDLTALVAEKVKLNPAKQ